MARKYLGDTFDIHGGAIDLRFPHHENEQAQSHAAGLGFARYWLHNAWLTASGEKMSKSLGNGMTVAEITQLASPLALRYYLSASHYRSTIEYHQGVLAEAGAAVERIEGFLRRVLPQAAAAARDSDATADATADEAGGASPTDPLPTAFVEAMDDDLNVSGALAVVHDTVRVGNTALDDRDEPAARAAAAAVIQMTSVLGVNPLDETWAARGPAGGDDGAHRALDVLVRQRLEARAAARQGRDFATADSIRDDLASAGVLVEDTARGARWSLGRRSDMMSVSHGR